MNPEYGHIPVHHLNSPTTIRMHGKVTHWEVVPFAGQKKATKGKAGFSRLESVSRSTVPLELLDDSKSAFRFFLGRYELGVEGAIFDRVVVGYRSMILNSWLRKSRSR